ncbi:MAG: hypothetical protein IKA40_05430 [Clostridia bacterium]|nr:hypothetical protein [Clostridia bacterium]
MISDKEYAFPGKIVKELAKKEENCRNSEGSFTALHRGGLCLRIADTVRVAEMMVTFATLQLSNRTTTEELFLTNVSLFERTSATREIL